MPSLPTSFEISGAMWFSTCAPDGGGEEVGEDVPPVVMI